MLDKELILIYQMGKVGSSTLNATLKELFGSEKVVQLHFLSESFKKRATGQAKYQWHLDQIVRVERFREANPNARIKIVTLAREPVERDISGFFQNPRQFLGLHKSFDDLTVDELIKVYKEKNNYRYTLNWFDNEFRRYTDIDIYSKGFEPDVGYKIFKDREYDVLLLTMERLNSCFQRALYEFLGVRVEHLLSANESKNKRYSAISRSFKGRIRLPVEELEQIYSSNYATSFYSPDDIDKLIDKWREP